MRQSAIAIALIIAALGVTGCGPTITRGEYEAANQLPVLTEFDLPNGDRRVVYGPDHDPQIDPRTNEYRCPHGVRIATYRQDILVSRWFQEHGHLKP